MLFSGVMSASTSTTVGGVISCRVISWRRAHGSETWRKAHGYSIAASHAQVTSPNGADNNKGAHQSKQLGLNEEQRARANRERENARTRVPRSKRIPYTPHVMHNETCDH